MRLKLVVAYVGSAYFGWQLQGKGTAMKTIQGQLEHALGLLAASPVRVHGSGRTDSGVHAEGQVCHCDFPDGRFALLKDMRHSLNAILPRDIRVFSVEAAAADFHARFDAHLKTYRYQFWQEQGFVPPMLDPYVWCCGPLDVSAMQKVLPFLLGEHDFAAFANAGSKEVQGTVRTLTSLVLEERFVWPACRPMLVLLVTGTGFLKQMVRNMAGLLAQVGRDKVDPHTIPALLAQGKREQMPTPTAPARGLTLVSVDYGQDNAGALRKAGEADRERAL